MTKRVVFRHCVKHLIMFCFVAIFVCKLDCLFGEPRNSVQIAETVLDGHCDITEGNYQLWLESNIRIMYEIGASVEDIAEQLEVPVDFVYEVFDATKGESPDA